MIVIPFRLPGMNEIIDANRESRYAGATQKATYTLLARNAGQNAEPVIGRVDVVCTWYCKDRRRDPDNVSAGIKFVLDGLIQAGVLQNDGWKQIRSIRHEFSVDKQRPRVEVELKEAR